MRALCTLANGGGVGYGQWMSYAIRIFEILNWTDLAGVNEVGLGVGWGGRWLHSYGIILGNIHAIPVGQTCFVSKGHTWPEFKLRPTQKVRLPTEQEK
jgi:hypothetical protein